jgi:hypothetical protein
MTTPTSPPEPAVDPPKPKMHITRSVALAATFALVAGGTGFGIGAASSGHTAATVGITNTPAQDIAAAQVLLNDAQAQLKASPTPTPSPSSIPSTTPTVTPTTTGTPNPTPSPTISPAAAPYDHVFLVPMENATRSSVIGNKSMPVINSLATTYAQAGAYVAACHPSLPNYLDFTSGSTQGKCNGNDASPILNVPNLFGDLTNNNLSWKSYVENLPTDYTTWNPNTGKEVEIGEYAAKHEPAVFYQSVMSSATERAKVVNYTALAGDLSSGNVPRFGYIGLNLINDGHDGTPAQADAGVAKVVAAIQGSTAWTSQRSLIVVTWDEGVGSNQTVAFLAIAKDARAGYVSPIKYGHLNLLATIQTALGDPADRSGGAKPMSDLFMAGLSPSPTPTTSPSPSVTIPASASPSVPPSPTPTATGPISFTWGAPSLVNPTIIALKDQQGSLKLDPTKDYVLQCAGNLWKNGDGLDVFGGHNVVMIGCTIDVGDGTSNAVSSNDAEKQKRAGYIQVGGEFYGQNLTFESSTAGHLTEGLDLAGNTGNDTLQGITMASPLEGSYTTNHADCMQAWAGPAVLDVDGFICNSGYQGFFLLPDQHSSITVSNWDLRNVHLTVGAYSLWRDGGTYAITTENVTVTGGRGSAGLWPNAAAWPNVTVN